MLCNMIPLVFENIPQFVNQLMFMIWIGDTSNMITTVSTMGSGLAILFQLMRSLSQGMVVQDEHFATPKQVAPAPDENVDFAEQRKVLEAEQRRRRKAEKEEQRRRWKAEAEKEELEEEVRLKKHLEVEQMIMASALEAVSKEAAVRDAVGNA
jgi:membrane peptidoglycan carboxypeptidase